MDARLAGLAVALCGLGFALVPGTGLAATNIRTLTTATPDSPADLGGYPAADSAISGYLTAVSNGACGVRRIAFSSTFVPTISTVAGFDCGTTNAGGPWTNGDPSNTSTRLGTIRGMSVDGTGNVVFGTGPGTCFGGCMVSRYNTGTPGDIDTLVNTAGANCPGSAPAENSAASAAVPCYIQDLDHSQTGDQFLILSANAGGITNRVFEVDISANTIKTVAGSCQPANAQLALRYCFGNPSAAAYVGNFIVVADNPSGTGNGGLVFFSRTTNTAGTAMAGSFSDPVELADAYDSGFFVATANCTLKHVSSPTANPTVRTVGGGACVNPSADDTVKPATQATFAGVSGLYAGPNGLSVADGTSDRIRLIERSSITSGPPAYSNLSQIQFAFESIDDGATFECSLVLPTGDIVSEEPCTSPKAYNVGEGAQQFRMRAKGPYIPDFVTKTWDFRIDRTPPLAFGLRTPGAEATGLGPTVTFTWDPAQDPPNGVTAYELFVDGAKAADVACPPAEGDACTRATVQVGEGERRWFVRARDQLSQATDSETRTFTAGGAPTAALAIAPNPVLVGRNVTFDGSGSSDAHGPISRFEWDLDGNGSFETDTGATPTTTRAYSAPGTIPITLRVTDASGTTATASGELRVNQPASAGGQFGVTINRGAQYTKSPDVVVSAAFPQATTTMLFSNDGGFLAPVTFTPRAEVEWKLDSSGPERLPKTIYVRFLTGPFVSETYQDDIILDETPPKVEQAVLAPPAGAASVAARKTFRLRLKATDSNSGVAKVQVTRTKRKPGKLLAYKRRLAVRTTARPRWVRARDRAGNYSRWRAVR